VTDKPEPRASLAPGAVPGTAPEPRSAKSDRAGSDRHRFDRHRFDRDPRPAAEDPGHHADVSGGWLRPAVFGAMDGLVTNIALIAGVGGGGVSAHSVVLTGVAGLVAGAISMGLGEFTSVRTQNEQVEHEVAKERRELEVNPHAEARELAERWVARGLPEHLAVEVAQALADNPEEALRVHAQEELGIDPQETPSPWVAAISSFVCFSVGALVPLLPYLLGAPVLWAALAAGGVGLFAAGAVVARFTNRPWWRSGLRQLVFGAAAAGVTYVIGRLIGGGAVG
jgi:VIT1/CCC1 family predicted Fe2+/Mn2+ transporter